MQVDTKPFPIKMINFDGKKKSWFDLAQSIRARTRIIIISDT
jgi:hypothetical protein